MNSSPSRNREQQKREDIEERSAVFSTSLHSSSQSSAFSLPPPPPSSSLSTPTTTPTTTTTSTFLRQKQALEEVSGKQENVRGREDAENVLFQKIESLLKTYHLSPIGVKLCLQWLKMSFSEPESKSESESELGSKSEAESEVEPEANYETGCKKESERTYMMIKEEDMEEEIRELQIKEKDKMSTEEEVETGSLDQKEPKREKAKKKDNKNKKTENKTKNIKTKTKKKTNYKDENSLYHVQKWILSRIGGKSHLLELKDSISPHQYYCPDLIPGLRSKPVWSSEEFEWTEGFLEHFDAIKSELSSLRDQAGFQPYRSPKIEDTKTSKDEKEKEVEIDPISNNINKQNIRNQPPNANQQQENTDKNKNKSGGKNTNDEGDWNVYYLYLHNLDFEENRLKCPVTSSLIDKIKSQYHHAFFSALAPGTHVLPHNGPTNKKLRFQLPIFIPPHGSCSLRVGDQIHQLKEREFLIFDDSYEHEAWNHDPNLSRIILIFDVWHPDLSLKEIKFFDFLRKAQLRAGKKISDQHFKSNNQDKESKSQPVSFFESIENGRKEKVNKEAIWSIVASD